MNVLDNLYSNPVHYGAESGNIYIRSSQTDSRLRIDVANTGTPIPTAEQEMIFEPFFRGIINAKGQLKEVDLG